MDTQKDLVNTLSNIQEKASSQNLNEKKLNTVAVSKINNHHHKLNKVHKSTFTLAILKQSIASHSKQERPITTSRPKFKKVINHNHSIKHNHGNFDQKVNEEDLYELFGLKKTKHLSENYLY